MKDSLPNMDETKGAYAHGTLPGLKELFAGQVPNMDEVSSEIKKALELKTFGELKMFFNDEDEAFDLEALGGVVIAQVSHPYDATLFWKAAFWLRLLIEERDMYKLWLEKNQADLLKSDLAHAEQDKELQQVKQDLRKYEIAILDALSIADMEQRDMTMEPWASLQETIK